MNPKFAEYLYKAGAAMRDQEDSEYAQELIYQGVAEVKADEDIAKMKGIKLEQDSAEKIVESLDKELDIQAEKINTTEVNRNKRGPFPAACCAKCQYGKSI